MGHTGFRGIGENNNMKREADIEVILGVESSYSYSLNSLKGGYIGDYIGNYYRAY